MEMYDALKCPEEEISVSTTTYSPPSSTLQDYEPKVIIKNPQKMMEDILNSISVADVEVDSNRLDAEAQQKMDFDLMMGDQPAATSDDDKKILLKLSEKKETFPKKPKKKSEQLKVKDDEQMQGDAPAEESPVTNGESDSALITTTDRQRRDANSVETTTLNELSTTTELPAETTNIEDLSSSISSTELTTAEQITTTAITDETTTKFIVQGHPLHMSQAIFKEPILPDVNNTHERIEIGESEDRFIPPMLLVKAKLATTTTELVGNEKETTIDASTDQTLIIDVTDINEKSSSSAPLKEEVSSEISINESQLTTEISSSSSENLITTIESSEKPILLEKRNDPRLGLKTVTTTIPVTTITQQYSTIQSSPIVTILEDLITSTDSSSSSSNIDESSSHESSSVFSITTEEIVETTSIPVDTSDTPNPEAETISSINKIDEATVEKLVALPIFTSKSANEKSSQPSSTSESVVKQTTPKNLPETNKSTTTMRNDINAYHQSEDSSREEESHERHYQEHHHYDENNFSNAENFQPYKPNRHRTIAKEHHHGPGFAIGKILG